MNALEILTQSYIDANSGITLGTGSGSSYLYDQRPSTQYVSAGSADGTEEAITIIFKNRSGTETSRTFDRIVLQNINLARFSCEYWNGSAWVSISESVYGAGNPNADSNLYIEIATPISATRLRLLATHTIVAGQEKKVGEFKACLFVSTVRHLVRFSPEWWSDGASDRLQGGQLFAWRNVEKLEGSLTLEQVSKTTHDAIVTYLRESYIVTLVLWDDFENGDIYEVRVQPGSYGETLDRKLRRYSMTMRVQQL